MNSREAAQEKPTGPRAGQASPRPWKQDAMYVVAEVEGGRPGGEVIVQCRPTRSWGIHDEARDRANAALIVEAVNAYRREAAAATPSLPDRERLRIAIKSELGCYMPEQNDDCDHGVIAARVLARLDEGSATPDQGKGEPR